MDTNKLKQFVENMRAHGMPDDEIERNLQVAGHQQPLVDDLLGKSPAQEAIREHRQDDQPVIDPNNRPQIIKDRSAVLKQQLQPAETETVNPAAPPNPAPSAPAAPKVVVTPQNSDVAPAAINSPSTSAVNIPTTPTPTPEPSPIPDNPNSVDAVTAAAQPARPTPSNAELGMPAPAAPPEELGDTIYPEASRGHIAHMNGPILADHPNPADLNVQFPEFISNPLVLLADSVKKLLRNAPFLLVAILLGAVLGVAFLKLASYAVELILEQLSIVGASFLAESGTGGIIVGLLIVVLVYDAIIAVYVSLYRTLQLSLTLDISRGDKPDLGGAFNRMFSWFGRIFFANMRLVLKLSVVFLFAAFVLWQMLVAAFDGASYLASATPFYIVIYSALFAILLILIRNSFVHLLMLENGSNRPSDSAGDSVTMVSQPRQKYVELFAWLGVATIIYSVFNVALEFIFPYTTLGSSIFTLEFYPTDSTNWGREIATTLFFVIVVSIHDLGVSRHFVTARGMLKSARQAGPINPLNFLVIILAIASVWGSTQIVSNIRQERWQTEYNNSYNDDFIPSSSSGAQDTEFDPDDWDENGIPDDEQCGEDEFAFPSFVEFDENTEESIYEIECI